MSSYSNLSFKRLPSETHGNHDKVLSGILKREPVTVQNVNLSVSRNSKFDVINPFMNAFAGTIKFSLYAMGALEIGLQTSYISLAVIFDAGLVTSLSPCTLSVLPLTHGYIGAFGAGKSRTEVVGNSIAFAMGLATTLALLGVAASFAGKAYDQIGQGIPVAASILAVAMGLNLNISSGAASLTYRVVFKFDCIR